MWSLTWLPDSVKGGLISKQPSEGSKAKNEPADPNTPSVSRNGEPYESRVALNGVAQHSCAQPHFLRTCAEIKIYGAF